MSIENYHRKAQAPQTDIEQAHGVTTPNSLNDMPNQPPVYIEGAGTSQYGPGTAPNTRHREDIHPLDRKQDEKKEKRRKRIIQAAAGALATATVVGGVFIGKGFLEVEEVGSDIKDLDRSPGVSAPEVPGQDSEKDKRSFPDSVVLSQNFDTLNLVQQEVIKSLHDMDFEEFSSQSLETRMLYGAWIRENNAERVLLQVLKQHEVGGRPLLNQTIQPSIDNTAQQIDDQRAEDLAINSYLTDWSDDRQAYNVLESKKFMSLGYLDGSELIDNHDQLLENPSKIGLTVSPCEVTTENVTTLGAVTYNCDKVVTEDGYSSSTISAKWQPFTDIHGIETGNWIITSGQNNR